MTATKFHQYPPRILVLEGFQHLTARVDSRHTVCGVAINGGVLLYPEESVDLANDIPGCPGCGARRSR